ncbi:MAG TPA: protein arginine kinase [Feifaniaceae bacterium]|nr:protein arginine kinase [Feifaniaceae bacterium]
MKDGRNTKDVRDIVLSSRVRLARNLDGLPFPHNMEEPELGKLIERVDGAINRKRDFMLMRMPELPVRERRLLVERHLISPDLAQSGEGAALISKDETVSILVGEEDHLRIQAMLPGMKLEEADTLSMSIDNMLSSKLPYAFDEELGYLTACPTNVGTGMRASVMLHLPALSLTGQTEALLSAISKLGYAVRGIYGEGSSAPGHIYQISNQMTLGTLEEDIVSNLIATVSRVIDHERGVRDVLYRNNRLEVEDIVYRSCGVLRYARKLSTKEAMENISNLKLGCGMGILPEDAQATLNRLLTDVQSACLEQRTGGELTETQRDEARASVVREAIMPIA